jgi:hypothetical protein
MGGGARGQGEVARPVLLCVVNPEAFPMRFKPVVAPAAIALLAVSAACNKQQPAPAPSAGAAAASAAASAVDANAIRGTISEKIDAGQYSYLKLRTGSGEVWTAVLKTDKKVGDSAAVVNAAWMQNFKSATLNRTWERIAFGALEEAAPQSAGSAAALPPGHPPAAGAGPGMFASQAAGGTHPPPSTPADVGVIKVAKAPGAQGRTVADVYAQKHALKDKKVSVRGKVVKATNGVLGKNWLHVRDGTGEGATADLSVASSLDTAAVGSTVLVTGVVHLDKDLGAGYHYDVLVEDAQIKTE